MSTLTAVQARSDALQGLAADAATRLEDADPREVMAWAGQRFGSQLCITSSMSDAVLISLAAEAVPGIDVVFLDTGYHFPDTLSTRDEIARRYDVNVVSVKPELSVAEQNVAYGQSLYSRDPDACCRMRKVVPLNAALAGYEAWGSGVRRDESPARAQTPVVAYDAKRNMLKLNPLATWTQAQVDDYAQRHGIVVNPLVDKGFLSIGCAPCTRAVAPGEDPRAGRWSGSEKSECGIHL